MRLLNDVGSAVDVDESIPLKRYFRSGKEMVRMAEVYHKEGNLERAYILYTKYITLFVEKMYKHPAMKMGPVPEWFQTKKKLDEVFPIAEKLKAELLEKYTQEYKILLKNKERQDAEEALQEERRKKEQLEQLMYEQQKLFALHQRQQQAKMVQPERPETPPPPAGGISPSGVYPMLLDLENGVPSTPRPKTPPFPTLSDLEVPDIPPRASKPSAPPLAPVDMVRKAIQAIPAVDRSTKPLPLLGTDVYFLGTQGLRPVVMPGSLMSKFLHLARKNTEKEIETCGVLAGKLSRNQLNISHLLVPKQSGTANTCFTESEEEVLEYQDQMGLDTIGWVHTHPTQTAFMSSVDLHTHCSYQLMLPEAVSVVCSPKYHENKIFNLTVDHGLRIISACRSTGFHLHAEDQILYEESRHVKVDEKASVTVVDLRA